jgi:alpha-beta hydrolase superfamily lysophospholipase
MNLPASAGLSFSLRPSDAMRSARARLRRAYNSTRDCVSVPLSGLHLLGFWSLRGLGGAMMPICAAGGGAQNSMPLSDEVSTDAADRSALQAPCRFDWRSRDDKAEDGCRRDPKLGHRYSLIICGRLFWH